MLEDKVVQFDAGDRIFSQGEHGNLMYILLQGAVDITMKVDRGETILKTVSSPNDFFGEMALLDDRPRSASAIATRRTRVIAVDGQTFETMILTNGKFALKIIKVLAERIRNSNTQVSELIETMPRERIARSMTDYAMHHGERIHEGSIKVNIEAMKAWINGHIGASVEEIDAAIFRLLKLESIIWAPTSAKTKECVILPQIFIQENDRRSTG